MTKNLAGIMLGVLILASVLMAGCGGKGRSVMDRDGSESGDDMEPLTEFEEAVVGHWVRYHGYDGSYDHFLIKTDRTACYWEVPNGGGRRDESTYEDWALVDTSRRNVSFEFRYGGGPSSLATFNYAEDLLYWGGYTNLDMGRSSSPGSCT